MTIEQIIEILSYHCLELALPVKLPVGKESVGLTITPETKRTTSKNSVFGCLNRFSNPSKIPDEKKAWEQAVQEKYEKFDANVLLRYVLSDNPECYMFLYKK